MNTLITYIFSSMHFEMEFQVYFSLFYMSKRKNQMETNTRDVLWELDVYKERIALFRFIDDHVTIDRIVFD